MLSLGLDSFAECLWLYIDALIYTGCILLYTFTRSVNEQTYSVGSFEQLTY